MKIEIWFLKVLRKYYVVTFSDRRFHFQRMENMLKSFQNDLGSISNEILSLQQQSVDMNLKLKNRQAVRGELSQFVDDMVVSEHMIM